MKDKPHFKVRYCKYCNEYATVKKFLPPDVVSDEPLTMFGPEVKYEFLCKYHARDPKPFGI
jgi:thymidine kinase